MSIKKICTKEEAMKEVNRRLGFKRTGYRVFVRPFLPTQDSKGFDGCALVSVTKKEFLKLIDDLIGGTLGGRGAKIEMTIPTADYESFIVG